jgi:amidophosphoribosyltransferase
VTSLNQLEGKPRCHCGIFGIFNHPAAAVMTYYGLHALQHRGQEATGIVSSEYSPDKKRFRFNVHKGVGLVTDVFRNEKILKNVLKGHAAIGHNRYSTTGSSHNEANIQPFTVNYKAGNLALGHNGNLTNFHTLRAQLQNEGTIFQSTSDSEIILHLAARSKQPTQILQLKEALEKVRGAYSLVILTDESLIAARDPHGFRPLALGVLPPTEAGQTGNAYVVASETCAFDIIGATYVRDIQPGEMLVIDRHSVLSGELTSVWIEAGSATPHPCIFEYIYFSRPDSKIFGENVDKVRRKLGKALAQESPVKPQQEDDKVVVISVPDSSNTATLGFVTESNKNGQEVRLEIGLIRSHYVGRTFIQPDQNSRELKVKTKYNTVKGALKGKTVVIVDDSIVRGTTSKQLVKLIREAEPKEIHFRVTSPPIKFPCHYGMDFPSRQELIANRCESDVQKIAAELNVDSLEYLSMEKLLESVPGNGLTQYCTACFSGNYPVPLEEPETVKDINDA